MAGGVENRWRERCKEPLSWVLAANSFRHGGTSSPTSQYEALAWLCGGLSFFASLGLLAVWNDKASTMPFAPKGYPYDNLRVELGGEP